MSAYSIHTFSSTVRCWNLAVFCMNYFSFPFGGPRMWAYSFTRLPWTSRTWGTALDGFLMPEFEEMIRWWCLIVTDSSHTWHTQRTISLLLKSSSPAAVAETLLSLSPFTRPHLHESIRAIEQSQVPDGSGLRLVCFFKLTNNWPQFQTVSMHQKAADIHMIPVESHRTFCCLWLQVYQIDGVTWLLPSFGAFSPEHFVKTTF